MRCPGCGHDPGPVARTDCTAMVLLPDDGKLRPCGHNCSGRGESGMDILMRWLDNSKVER